MEQTTGKASHIKAVIFAALGNIIWGATWNGINLFLRIVPNRSLGITIRVLMLAWDYRWLCTMILQSFVFTTNTPSEQIVAARRTTDSG